jgi:Tetratricopeptide repeat
MYQQLLRPECPDTANCMNNLAFLYVAQAKYTETERVHQQVLTTRLAVLLLVHPEIAQSLQNLACLYMMQGDPNNFAEAEQLLLQSLAIRKQILGQDHPQMAKSLQNLAPLNDGSIFPTFMPHG